MKRKVKHTWMDYKRNENTLKKKKGRTEYIRGYVQKFPDWVDNEINNKHLLRINTKGYGGKTH
jgi:hypothetical protein